MRAEVVCLDTQFVEEKESVVVERARAGNADALEDLIQRHRRAAYLLALQLLRNPDDALDVAQEALLRFMTTIHRFKAGNPVRPWLLRIVRNLAIDQIRRRSVRREAPRSREDDEILFEPVDNAPSPEAQVSREELQRRVWEAVGSIKPMYKEILILRDYQDLSYNEIAVVLKIPVGTVMSRLHKARCLVRESLLAMGGTPWKTKGGAA